MSTREQILEKAISDACDLLAERTYGSPARSPGHNARLRLEQALVASVYTEAHAQWANAWGAALQTIERTTFSGSEMDEAYMRGNRDAHATCASIARSALAAHSPAGDDWQAMCEAERRFSAKQAAEIVRLSGELSQARAQVEGEKWRTDFENAPSEAYEFFLVRPRGTHPSRGGPFHPTIVQRIEGKFYTSDNELDPIYFGQDEPDDSPLKTTLEWKPFPADWLSVSSTVEQPNE